MKPFLIAGNIILLGIIFFQSCVNSKARLSQTVVATPSPAPACDNDRFYGLTIEDFFDGIARYRDKRWNVINPSVQRDITDVARTENLAGFQDARVCWYSLDTLEKYICLIKKYSGQLGMTTDQLGINFYYAVYPDHPWYQPYYRDHTIFMAPTYSPKDRPYVNIAFDPRYTVYLQDLHHSLYPPQTLSQMLLSARTSHLWIEPMVMDPASSNGTADASATITTPHLMKNQGQLCPNYPNCPVGMESVLATADIYCPPTMGYTQP